MSEEVAVCRGCGGVLKGSPYANGGYAYHPVTGDQCKSNFYGGWVCSRNCDFRASLELERTMPGHSGDQQRLGCFAQEALSRNWPD
jgi:hypothetical protein